MAYLKTVGWIVPKTGENSRRSSQWWVDPRVHELFASGLRRSAFGVIRKGEDP